MMCVSSTLPFMNTGVVEKPQCWTFQNPACKRNDRVIKRLEGHVSGRTCAHFAVHAGVVGLPRPIKVSLRPALGQLAAGEVQHVITLVGYLLPEFIPSSPI